MKRVKIGFEAPEELVERVNALAALWRTAAKQYVEARDCPSTCSSQKKSRPAVRPPRRKRQSLNFSSRRSSAPLSPFRADGAKPARGTKLPCRPRLSLGSLSSGSPGFATGGLDTPGSGSPRANSSFFSTAFSPCRRVISVSSVGNRLAGPADIALAALRDLTGSGVEPQHAVDHRVEAIAAVFCCRASHAAPMRPQRTSSGQRRKCA